MLSMNTNAGASSALRSLSSVHTDLASVRTRLSTGLKVSSAADDGGLWGMAAGLRSDIVDMGTELDSVSRTVSTLEVTLAALDGISDIVMEMRETALALSDNSLDAASFAALEAEYGALFEQTVKMAESATFNGINLLDGSTVSLEPLGMDAIASGNLVSLLQTGVSSSPAAVDVFGIYTNYSSTVTGSFSGIDHGTFSGDVWGNVSGIIGGDFNGDIYGNFDGIIDGNFNGTLYGTFSGILGGAVNGTIHNGAVAPPNPFSFDAEHAAFEDDISGSFTGIDTPSPADATAYKGRVSSLGTLLGALGKMSARMGTTLRSAEMQHTFMSRKSDVYETARGQLVDTDLARDSARLTALQTREQLAVQALAIANAAPTMLTRLFT
ncbi:flagellin [Maricaulis sp.]|uniref:flagellin N-terminal helical domain-containing protein n=1 Tax=Maricaulis sp. TaxID=1486257 RepID=UPI003A94A621